ncbi:FMN-dependent NADH-azoreductase [Montanilutibacter psychrotolerans]|uniref:FMN dependent NADH:quinone oxidoreductase n=1 Tax=Montanilutibacter psychrotolerans TaxID=1327343 RepID=A0A3M8SR84_9GAMM|nr:NAD(P)H-dependent oxidoreductase [Lysobacter psychrotolerans]RNF83225.1 FMN-dependent NADH-azoreductase [Lysobacter psychrotolerans]
MKLLHIDSSILGQNSASRELSAAIAGQWTAANPGMQVVYRDLAASPLPHLSGSSLAGADPAEAAEAAAIMEEFLAADVIVIGAPMYNFNIPSQLKAWIDRIAIAGKTFRYTANGPEGLAGGKKVVFAGAYGGLHAADAPSNFIEPYLRHMLRFLGIDDVEFITAEGLAMSAEQRAKSLQSAHQRIDEECPLAMAA